MTSLKNNLKSTDRLKLITTHLFNHCLFTSGLISNIVSVLSLLYHYINILYYKIIIIIKCYFMYYIINFIKNM